MASTYPGSLDAFTTIASDKKTSDSVGGRTHRDMHNDLGDAIEAVQAELGTDPAGTYSTVKARLDALVAYSAKTSAYTATVADHTLNVTSGTFTLDLPAASTCTGQSLKVKNSGTGVVTLDGNSSETVEGVATFPLGPGSYIETTSTGSAWILTSGTPDTGWRNVGTDTINGWGINANANEALQVRRRGSLVMWRWGGATAGSNANFIAAIAGFRSTEHYGYDIPSGSGGGTARVVVVSYSSGLSMSTSSFSQYTTFSYPTDDAWPTSLPGSAA